MLERPLEIFAALLRLRDKHALYWRQEFMCRVSSQNWCCVFVGVSPANSSGKLSMLRRQTLPLRKKCCTAGLIFVGFKRTWDQTVVSRLDVAEVPDHTLLPVAFRRYKHYRHLSWFITLTFYRTDNNYVPVCCGFACLGSIR